MSSFNIEAISKLEKCYYLMKDLICNYVEKYIEFLDLIVGSVKVDLNKIERWHHHISEISEKIETLFEQINDNPRSILLYMNFKRDVRDDNEITKVLEKRIDKLLELTKLKKYDKKLFHDVNLMFEENTALIEIGALTDNMGIIVKCNPGAEKLTGYSINELLAMNIKEIMPSPFKELH
jgi:PAS domain-containing protein